MKDREIIKLRNSIALKDISKIIIISFTIILIFFISIDTFLNDFLAENMNKFDRNLYFFFMRNKTNILAIISIFIFILVTFFVIRRSNKRLIGIINAMDNVMKEPENEVKLPSELIILENQLNNIRIDLINNKNIAKDAEMKKNDLIMYMAHDLKTPLTSTIGYLSLLEQEKEISDTLREKYLKIALDKALRVEELTNQFFEITKYNLHDMPIIKSKIDLSLLLDQLLDEAYPMLQTKNLKFNVKKPKTVSFFGDGDKLARAFGNLIKNAINYSYENTEIIIDVEKKNEKINILFKNKGEKIPEYKLDKIFERFYRVDESRTTSTGGTGLGLAITKDIIELHNGKIYVKNDDEYIEFYVEL